MKSQDVNRRTAKAVSKITRTARPKGEDLLGSPELRKQLQDAKKKR